MAAGKKGFKQPTIILILFVSLLVSVIMALGIGAVPIPPGETVQILGSSLPLVGRLFSPASGPIVPSHFTIVTKLRLPRVLLAVLVGSSLAVSGATFQGLFKNPMADPYIIGVSAGAALGGTTALALSMRFRFLGIGAVPFFAFLGALLTMILVYNLARVGQRVPVMSLLLAGIAVGSVLQALVSLVTYFSESELQKIVFWLMGSLAGRSWDYFFLALPYVLVSMFIIWLHARDLNALLLGEEPAQHLGIDVERTKKYLLWAASMLTAVAVATSGLIGFVGLVVPHVVRLLFGPDHRLLLPAAALSGAVFLVWVDTCARILLPPQELPVGILTALLGGPFFLYLLRKRKNTLY
ncbi:MAG TPA: iron chelate uptake ABC transporter family permease subunit [Firmicutes bacterium]|nr:iron chelate uptake ABC transporter family permease subunit [Bacillota bacterium]